MRFVLTILLGVIASWSYCQKFPNHWQQIGEFYFSDAFDLACEADSNGLFVIHSDESGAIIWSKINEGSTEPLGALSDERASIFFVDNSNKDHISVYRELRGQQLEVMQFDTTGKTLLRTNSKNLDFGKKLNHPRVYELGESEYAVMNFEKNDTIWYYNGTTQRFYKVQGRVQDARFLTQDSVVIVIKNDGEVKINCLNLLTNRETTIANVDIKSMLVEDRVIEDFRILPINGNVLAVWYMNNEKQITVINFVGIADGKLLRRLSIPGQVIGIEMNSKYMWIAIGYISENFSYEEKNGLTGSFSAKIYRQCAQDLIAFF